MLFYFTSLSLRRVKSEVVLPHFTCAGLELRLFHFTLMSEVVSPHFTCGLAWLINLL